MLLLDAPLLEVEPKLDAGSFPARGLGSGEVRGERGHELGMCSVSFLLRGVEPEASGPSEAIEAMDWERFFLSIAF